MSEKILTISVAAYNLEKLIEDNLKSFCNSSVIDDIEIIITDDESKDGTVKIIKEYQKEYPDSIKLIQQKNAGPGSTVNNGIKNASGLYFKMVDGDDWVEKEGIEKLVSYLKNHKEVDLVINDYQIYSDKEKRIIDKKTFNLEKNKIINFDEIKEYNEFPMHSATYKTSLFQNNEIIIDNGFYTDVEYLLLPIKYVKKLVYLDFPVYDYRIAMQAQSMNITSMLKNVKMHEKVLFRLADYYENCKNELSKGQKIFMASRIAQMAGTQLSIYLNYEINSDNKQLIKSFIKRIKCNYSDVYEYFKKMKKEKILIYSNFLLYPLISKLIVKKYKGGLRNK